MKYILSTGEAADMLLDDKNADWTYNGARAIAEYLESLEEETGEDIGLDVCAIRCEYSEYSSAVNAVIDCGFNVDDEDDEDDDEREKIAIDYLRDNTSVIEFEGGVIIQDF